MNDEQETAPAVEKYLGAASIADHLRVTRSAVNKWRDRYPFDSAHPFPAPDVETDGVPGWHPSRLGEIEKWRTGMPGSGKQLSAADRLAERMLEAFEDHADESWTRRLEMITERRRPGETFMFGYVRTNPRASRTTHLAYADQLEDAGCEVVRAERLPGDDLTDGLLDLIDHMQPGDTLLVPRAAHLSRLKAPARRAVELVEARGGRVEWLYGVGPSGTD